jgi:hypothetical protein
MRLLDCCCQICVMFWPHISYTLVLECQILFFRSRLRNMLAGVVVKYRALGMLMTSTWNWGFVLLVGD